MTPDDFIPLFRAVPFVPFVVQMNNGQSYTVRHLDQGMISGETLHISQRSPEGRPEVIRCAMINVASIQTPDDFEAA